jgi:host factor-I protein
MAFSSGGSARKSRTPPPDDTHQESAYLKLLGEKQRPVCIKLMDGDSLHGWIEYYDRRMVRLTREGAPNLFIFKHQIAYIADDVARRGRPENASAAKTGNSRGPSD